MNKYPKHLNDLYTSNFFNLSPLLLVPKPFVFIEMLLVASAFMLLLHEVGSQAPCFHRNATQGFHKLFFISHKKSK